MSSRLKTPLAILVFLLALPVGYFSIGETIVDRTTFGTGEIFEAGAKTGELRQDPPLRSPGDIFSDWSSSEWVTIEEGDHIGKPKIQDQNVHWMDVGWDYTGWVIEMNDSAHYDLASNPQGNGCSGAGDQADWNKLIGQTWKPFLNAQKNTAMIGWRYFDESNNGENQLQLTPYYHDTLGNNYHGDYPSDLYPVPVLDIEIDKPYYIIYRLGKGGTKKFEVFMTEALGSECFDPLLQHTIQPYDNVPEFNSAHIDLDSDSNSRQVNAWFGGSCKAPNEVTFRRRILDSAQAGYIYGHLKGSGGVNCGGPIQSDTPIKDAPGAAF